MKIACRDVAVGFVLLIAFTCVAQEPAAPSRIPGSTNLQEQLDKLSPRSKPDTNAANADPVDIDPKAKELKDLGWDLFFKKNRPKEGVEKVEAAIKIDPRMPAAYNFLANWYSLGKSDNETALRYVEQGIKHCPQSSSVRVDLGNVYARMNQPTKAIEQFTAALDLGEEGKASVFYNIGNAYIALDDKKQAINSYCKALVEDSKHLNARRNLVVALVQTGESKTARQEAQKLLQLDPDGEKGAWAKRALQQMEP